MFNNRIFTDFDTIVQPVQKFTANAKIHGKRQNSQLPWIRDFRQHLSNPLTGFGEVGREGP